MKNRNSLISILSPKQGMGKQNCANLAAVHWVFVTKVSAQASIALPGAMVKLTQPLTEIDMVYPISGFIWPGITHS